MPRPLALPALALSFLVAASSASLDSSPGAPPVASPVFSDVTDAAGLHWGIRRVALRGWNIVETMGGGGGFVDYDGDGRLDIYLVSYSTLPQEGRGGPVGDALYRNNGDGTFTDVTEPGSHPGQPPRHGTGGGGLRQRRPQRSLRHRLRLERPLPQRRGRHVP